jgi:hypothetical protein
MQKMKKRKRKKKEKKSRHKVYYLKNAHKKFSQKKCRKL